MTELKQIKIYINSQSEIISDIAGIFKMFDIPDNDIKTRWQVLEMIAQHQSIILLKKANEVKKIEQTNLIIAEKINDNQNGNIVYSDAVMTKTDKISQVINDENVQMYIDLINEGTPLADIIQDISSHKNAQILLSKVLLNYLSELKTYTDLLKEANGSSQEEMKEEIEKVKEIVSQIRLFSSIQEIEDAEEENIFVANYKVIFNRTELGNNDFLSDIEKLDPTSYKNIVVLFKSLLEGNMISYRKITNHGTLKGMKEVRLSNCRIAFIFEGSYCAILSAFVKKSNIDMVTYDSISKRITRFHKNKDKIIQEYEEDAIQKESLEIIEFLDDNKRMCGK